MDKVEFYLDARMIMTADKSKAKFKSVYILNDKGQSTEHYIEEIGNMKKSITNMEETLNSI